MGKFSTLMLSNMLLFISSFNTCGSYYPWTYHLASDIYLIEIWILCFIKQPPIFSFLVIYGASHLNICDARQPPSYLCSCCHNEDEADIEPQNVEKSNSVVGYVPTGLNPISAYSHMIHVA